MIRRTAVRAHRASGNGVLLRLASVLALLATALVVVPAPLAHAAGSITLEKTSSGTVLLGGATEYTLSATNPDRDVEQYNLSFTDTLPVGVTYVPGSTTPASFGEPQVITITDAVSGETHQVLVWSNVSDMTPGADRRLSFSATVDDKLFPIGSTVTNNASAFSSSDPREVPAFDAKGEPIPGTEVVSASDRNDTQVTAVRITKASGVAGEGAPEDELLRGVNDHQAVYSLRVTNNGVDSTGKLVVTDYLPAGLEFLGCGGDFNSAEPEYPGAGNTVTTVANCTRPTTVETVTDPAGHPAGVYTKVTWKLADLAAGEQTTIRYAAGIPQRANTATWPDATPDPDSGRQAANLDNNTGASTRETASELALRNFAEVAGDFQGAPVADSTSHTVTAEDLRIVKGVSPTTFHQGDLATYTLTIDTSEYADADSLVITDVMPDGLCPMGTSDPGYTPSPECDPKQGAAPTNASITGVVANPDGSFTLTITPDKAALAANGTLVITYQALMQQRYDADDTPTSATDAFTNTVRVDGVTTPRRDVNAPDPAGEERVSDESSATITSEAPTLEKLRMANATPMQCSKDTDDYDLTFTDETAFTEGDRVCFLLRVDFPDGVDTKSPQLTDFLPPNVSYESATVLTGADLVASTLPTTPTNYVTWLLGTGKPRVVPKGSVFDVVLSGIVTNPPALTSPPKALAKENLAKFRWTNSAGRSESLRDSRSIPLGPPPPIGVTKGVRSINGTDVDAGATPGNVDGSTVRADDRVTFRIDVANLAEPGEVNADDIVAPDVWDVLPPGLSCAAAGAISDGGACYDAGDPSRPNVDGNTTASVIRWQLPASVVLAPGASRMLTYDLQVPTGASVSSRYDNTAAVSSYASATNIGGATPPVAVHNPANNISADVLPADEDVPEARDTSWVVVPDAAVTKRNTTAITETGNSATQAVVGETVTYTVGVRIPAHTSVFNAKLVDPMPTGLTFVGPATAGFSATGTSPAAAALPPGVTLDTATGTLTFGTAYANTTSTDQLFEVTIPARVGTDAGNTHDVVRTNSATFTSDSAATGGTAITPRTATSAVTVVTPSPSITKTANPTTANGGDTVTYTIRVTNASGRPPLHDTFVIDCLPGTMVFAAYGTPPAGASTIATVAGDGTNGCAAGTTRLAWQLGSRPGNGTAIAFTYTATVNTVPAGGDSYQNTATVKGSTLNDGKTDPMGADNPLERVHTVSASATLTVGGASIAKSAGQATLTIGQTGTFTVRVTIPRNTAFYDSAVIDAIPTGMSYVTGSSTTTCTNADATACSVPGTELTPSGTTVGWLVGDLSPITQARTIVITYSARMNDIAGNTAGTARTNTVRYLWNRVNGTDPTSAGASWAASTGTATATVTVVEPLLTLAKTVDDATVEPGQTFSYTVTATNNGRGANLSPAYNYTVTDTVPAGVVVASGSISGGGTLAGTDANGSGGTITWGPIAGPLAANASAPFTYSATLAPSATLTSATRTNTARVTHYESLPSGGRTTYAVVTATAEVTPQFPHVTPTKAVATGPAYLGQPKTWTVTLTNDGTADARHASAVDTLPANWTYDAGSARVVIGGGSANAIEPDLTVASGHQVLTWSDLGTIPATGANRTIVITFTATPNAPGALTDPGVGASVPHTNSVTAGAQDGTGEPGNASGSYGGGPATASTHIDSADVRITKTSGDAVAGANLVYTLTVGNLGPDAAVGPFPVTDTLPSGLGAVTASGTGWTCSVATTTVTCTRTNPANTLASGASFPAITITAAVPADTTDGTVLTNAATVTSGTYDPVTGNNRDEVTDTVDRAADLGVVKTTVGTPVAGTDLTYTLDVTNHGPSDSAGPITITDTLPTGITFRSATGPGWSCDRSGRTLTCTRSAGLTNGQAAPQVVVVVGVDADTTGSLRNTATVDGPETDTNPDNDTSTVADPVRTSADLALQKSHVGEFVPGGEATYEFTVTNFGPSDAAQPVRVTDQLPAELTFVSDDSGAWDCAANASNLLTCTLDSGLAVGASRTFRATVRIDSAQTGDVTNSATVSSPTDDPNPPNNTDDDTTGVTVEADLGIAKSHDGDATAGEALDFRLVVTNHGRSDTPGTLTVSDTLPAGMSYASASGGGWSCSASGQVVTCTRASGLAAGASSTITLRVDVASDAGPATLTNHASVAGPAPDPVPGNNTDTDDVTVVDRANVAITKTASRATAAAGSAVDWTLRIRNDGPSHADNVQVSDALPPGLELVGVDASAPVTCGDDDPVACSVASMAPGAAYDIVVHTRVGSGVADGTTIANTATISTSTPGDDPDDNEASDSVDVTTAADLSIRKTHEGAAVAGEQLTFDLAVHNAGPSDASADVVVTDTLPVGLTYVSSTGTGWTCVAGTPTASGQQVTCTLPDAVVADTDAPALALRVQVASDLEPGEVTNTAGVTSPTTDPDTDNNADGDAVDVTGSADLSIAKTHAGPVRIGDPLEFTLQVANDGPSTARGVHVADELPAGLEYVSAAGEGWTCAGSGGTVTCDLAELAAGESAEPITVTVTVLASAYPSVVNPATVDATTPDSDRDDNRATDEVVVPPQVDLGITKSHEPEPLQVGDRATYTIGVSNAGATDDPGPLTVTDTLPVGLSFVSGGGDGWTCAAAGQDVTCTREDGLATTGNTSFALVVQVGPEAYPGVTNTASVTSPAEDTNPDNNTAQDPATVLPLYDLSLVKELDSITSSRADWTITVTNNGPNEAPSGVVVTDDLPSELSFLDWTGDGWECVAAGRLVTCTWSAPIALGESVGFTLHTAVDPDASGTITNTAGIVGGETDSAGGEVPAESGGGLASTGGIAAGTGLLGLLLIAAGLVLVRRRRRILE